MTCFLEASPEERAMIPNIIQPNLINNIKIEEIDQRRVIHALKMNKRDK